MAVCRLAILSYRDGNDLGNYDICDLQDCINFAEWQLELGVETGFDGQDWCGFIKWAKSRINDLASLR